ncbi:MULTISPECIES: hypothetical protein [Photorhabdus]|uniref:Uncharacterized protein n=2 Tax=Photorhabdus TaxID=29487 RepID=A0AAW6BND8_9GAMM|nr:MULTISPECIES: hypothetical protein [Photorhabdus]EYU13920.1 hypothetical protein BA1DRAFT_03605 [Photorhabdus aegyptia]MDB6374953.1 hypothetical protein [Photorhabdus bodei]
MVKNKFRITHTYAINKASFYGVKTNLSLTELNHILAYLQLMHFSLPNFSFLDDDIGEPDAVVLLHNIYGVTPLTEEVETDGVIDLGKTNLFTSESPGNYETLCSS